METPGWQLVDGKLHRDFQFRDFKQAFAFMTAVALVAEKLDHHPDWSNSWNKVTIDIINHSVGAVTERCHQLAAAINEVAPESV